MKIYSSDEMIEFGRLIGTYLKMGDCLLLKGSLASGKTTFTKGIGKALHIKEVINSPTFNILKIYEGKIPLYHIDAYRLENNDYDLGLDEHKDEVITVIEWPEYYNNLPDEYLEITFNYVDENTRQINLVPKGNRYKTLIADILPILNERGKDI